MSINIGIPSLKPFQNNVFYIEPTLVTIATETEQLAKRFLRDKIYLNNTDRYYRFNVNIGLKDIKLKELKKKKKITAATRRYIKSQNMLKQMQKCADNVAGREY